LSGPYRAVVFDLDGVLWDGEPLYHEAFNVVLRPYGKAVTPHAYMQIIGSSTEAAWQWVLDHLGIDEPLDGFIRQYDVTVMEMLDSPIEPLPGVRDLLAALQTRGVPIALATASFRNWADSTLRGIGLEGAFAATVTASEVKDAKPAPDLYLQAASQLGVDSKLCVAVEDSRNGVRSAKAAGMFAIQSRASSTALPPIEEADRVIERYDEFDFGLLTGA
jgi:HAD superfamily hydrolase (TIGR01509 family)